MSGSASLLGIEAPPRAMREHHRRAVFSVVRSTSQATQEHIATATGLSKATVSRIVGEFLEDGIVEVVGNAETTRRGRKPSVVQLKPRGRLAVGIELGERTCVVCLTDLQANLMRRAHVPTDYSSVDGLLGTIENAYRRAAEDLDGLPGVDHPQIAAIGVAATGMATRVGVRQLTEHFDNGIPDLALAARIEKQLRLPVVVTDRSKAAAVGEFLHGAGRGARDLVYVRIGTGIAAGVILGGSLQYGATGNTAELGHLTVDENGPACVCGSNGCLQTLAGGDALSLRARQLLRAGEASMLVELVNGALDLIDGLVIVEAAAAGDTLALRLLEDAGRYLGRSLASVVGLLNPDTIILGGRVGAAAAPFFEASMSRELRAWALPIPAGAARIVPGTLGDDAASVGAAALALERAPLERKK